MPFNATYNAKPTAPISLTATADGGYTRMKLAWTDTSKNRDGFEIHRSGDGATGWAFVATVRRTSWGDGVNYYTDTGLTRGNTYYYRIRGFNGAGFGRWSNVANDTIWQLSDVTIYAEYDANTGVYQDDGKLTAVSSDGDPVGAVADQSGNGYDILQATAGNKPTWQTNELNGLPVIRGALDDYLQASTVADWKFLNDGTEFGVYVVWKTTGTNPDSNNILLDTGAGASARVGFYLTFDDRSGSSRDDLVLCNIADSTGGGDFEAQAITPNESVQAGEWHVTGARLTSTQLELWNDSFFGGYDDGAADGSPDTGNPAGALTVGARYDGAASYLLGDWARIIIISGTVSDANHNAVQDYLTEEYDLFDNAWFGSESILQEDVGGLDHNSAPGICVAPNGELVVVYDKETAHAVFDGDLVLQRSSDGGATWNGEEMIWDYSTDGGGTDFYGSAKIATLSNNVLIISARKLVSGSPVVDPIAIFTSNDNGVTWNGPTQRTEGIYTEAAGGNGGGVIELANGDLLLPYYGRDTGDASNRNSCAVLRSQDKGVTWSALATIADGPTDSLNYSEAALVQITGGDVLALIREEISFDMYMASSSDNGGTWGATSLIADARGANHDVIELATGEIVSVVRDVTDANNMNRLLYSGDGGSSWQQGYRFANSSNHPSTTRTSGGSVVQGSDGTIYIAYGSETTDQTTSDIMFVKRLNEVRPFQPDQVDGLVLWLKADAGVYNDAGSTLATNGQTVQEWHDQSGNGNDFAQTTAADKPDYITNSINGLPTIDFDGVSEYLEAANFDSSQEGFVLAVIEMPTVTNNNPSLFASSDEATTLYFWILAPYHGTNTDGVKINIREFGDTDNESGATKMFANVPYVLAWNASDGSYRTYRQGLRQQLTTNTDTLAGEGNWVGDVTERDNFTIGALKRTSVITFTDAKIGELLFYNTNIGTTNFERVVKYLADRWGVSIAQDIEHISSTSTSQSGTHGIAVFDNGDKCLTVDKTGDRIDCWDISDKANPSILSSITTTVDDPHYIVISNDEQYAYTADGAGVSPKLHVIDISTPASISIDNSLALTGESQQIVLDSSNNFAYVAGYGSDIIEVVDISPPTAPSVVGSISGAGTPNFLDTVAHLAISSDDQVLFAASYGDDYIGAFNISTPESISLLDVLNTNLNDPHGITLDSTDSYLFIANMYGSDRDSGALVVYDVGTPSAMAYETRILMDGASSSNEYYFDYLHLLYREGNALYGATQLGTGVTSGWANALTKFDVTDPTAPTVEWSYMDGDLLNGNQETVKSGNYLICACKAPFLSIYKIK